MTTLTNLGDLTDLNARSVLEHDQLVANTSLPIPRAVVGGGLRAGLWALRVFTILLAAMVVCAFVLQLRAG